MCKKYPVRLSYIMPAVLDQPYYSFMLKNAESNEWLKTVYSVTIYEGMLKTALYLYGYIKKNYRKDGE
jgi:hypothetical protein